MSKREEALENLENAILKLAEYYPEYIFPEITPDQINEVCKLLGFEIDRISAMVLRSFTKQLAEKAKKALSIKDKANEANEKNKWLLPCPFCGSDNLHVYLNAPRSDIGPWEHVACLNCGAGQSTKVKWNTRNGIKMFENDICCT